MQKIKITSTSGLIKPKALDNIDISYGISYITDEGLKILRFNEIDSWAIKTLSKIDRFIPFFKKDKEEEYILNLIIANSEYISKQKRDDLSDLHIQFNTETQTTQKVNEIIKNKKIATLNNEAAFYVPNTNSIFLGINAFKKGNECFDIQAQYLTIEQSISYTFFHEYAHSLQAANYKKYGQEKTNGSFDILNFSLHVLNKSDFHSTIHEKIMENEQSGQEKKFKMPSKAFVNTFKKLFDEMYADTTALLLLRNKAIDENNFNEENFQKSIQSVIQIRKKALGNVKKVLEENNKNIVPYTTHFTAPAVENLSTELKEILKEKSGNHCLSDSEIHHISDKCVKIGMAKSILAITKADSELNGLFETIFSIHQDYEIMIDINNNHYEDALNNMWKIVPSEWKNNFQNNLNKIDSTNPGMIFDGALDYESFNIKLSQLKEKGITKEKIVSIRDSLTLPNQPVELKI